MSYVLTCPNCGVREVTDFAFGGELNPRPKEAPSLRELGEYNYFRSNVAGVQQEWWLHRSGCGEWFIAERDTRTNEVHWTARVAMCSGRRLAARRRRRRTGGAAAARDPGAASGARLPEQRGERIDRDTEVTFTFDGRAVTGLEGDTIGSALFAGGQRTFSRSFKYHRRRGLLCCAGQCPNCLVVGRRRSRRARLHRAGARGHAGRAHERVAVARVRRDARHRPLRRPVHAAGLLLQDLHQAAPAVAALREGAETRRRAREAAQVAARARVADRVSPPPRRRARDRGWGRRAERGGGGGGARGRRGARRRGARAGRPAARRGRRGSTRASWPSGRAAAGVEILANAPALGTFDGLVPVWQGDTLHQIRAQRQIFATGAIEQPLLFPGNDLPGVMLSGGARRLIGMYAVKPGMRAVVATVDDRGLHAALALLDAGVEVVLRGRPARARERRARRGARADERRPDARLDGARGARAQPASSGVVLGKPGVGRGPDRRLRPARGVGRDRARHLARRTGGREDGVRRVARPLRARRGAGRRAGRRRAHRARENSSGGALGRGRRCRGGARARASATTASRARARCRARAARGRRPGRRRSPCRRR